jgi:DNA/RNA endonuclease YhcR with UshA esterase domain
MNANVRLYLTGVLAIPVFILCVSSPSWAQEQIKRLSADQTQAYTNHTHKVIVTGKVVEVFETDKAVHLNFGKPRPAQNFTVLVTQAKASSFPGLKEMKGKTLEATGHISEYSGKPIMYLSQPGDLKIVPETK